MPTGSARRRQPLLISTRSPLGERFGDDFFRTLPTRPGVYFFRDAAGTLLYIGQSGSLRHRLGSYRHVDPDRHPRRLLRLVQRVVSIDWTECESAVEAIALEARLLLEHRPPFNRAGVWPSAEWWLEVRVEDENRLHLRMTRTPDIPENAANDSKAVIGESPEKEMRPGFLTAILMEGVGHAVPEAASQWHGPFSSRLRHTFPSLTRCLFLTMHPGSDPWTIPVGLMRNSGGLACSWILPADGAVLLKQFTAFLSQPCEIFPSIVKERLAASPRLTAGAALREFWDSQLEEIAELIPQGKREHFAEPGRDSDST